MEASEIKVGHIYQHKGFGVITILEPFQGEKDRWNAKSQRNGAIYRVSLRNLVAYLGEPGQPPQAAVIPAKPSTLPPQCKLALLTDFEHIWRTTLEVAGAGH